MTSDQNVIKHAYLQQGAKIYIARIESAGLKPTKVKLVTLIKGCTVSEVLSVMD